MMYLIKVSGGEYCHKINRGNYYCSEMREFCYLDREKAKRYSKRLSEMGVKHELIITTASAHETIVPYHLRKE